MLDDKNIIQSPTVFDVFVFPPSFSTKWNHGTQLHTFSDAINSKVLRLHSAYSQMSIAVLFKMVTQQSMI